jgi:hypothetical protein
MAIPILRPLAMGEVLDTAFGLYRDQFIALVTIAAATQAIPGIFGIYLEVSGAGMTNLGLSAIHVFLGLLFGSVGVAASTFVISGTYLGENVDAREALGRAGGFILPLVVITILSTLMTFVGFLLLIVPGFIVIAALALSNAALVIEAPVGPTEAMRRSWSLTKGARGKVLITLFVGFALIAIPAFTVGMLSAIADFVGAWPTWLTSVMVFGFGIFMYPFLYAVVVVLYYDLRVRKEGFDLELLARVAPAP